MKILIIGNSSSVYVSDFVEHMQKATDAEVNVISPVNGRLVPDKRVVETVFAANKHFSRRRFVKKSDIYDICHVHYVNNIAVNLADILPKKCRKIIVSVWGSDFYRTTDDIKAKQKSLFDVADYITLANKQTLDAFDSYFNHKYHEKLRLCVYGLPALRIIRRFMLSKQKCREWLCLPTDTKIVTIWHNASKIQQHLEVIESIRKAGLPELVHFIVPMTYGSNNEYSIETVADRLRKAGFSFTILKDFMNPTEIATLRSASDIMIQVQTTDVLSGSMLEHLYADNIVITGDWLPYKVLDDNGIFMLKVSYVSQVGEMLTFAINNYEELCKENKDSKEFIWGLASWEANLESWINLYKGG